MLTEIQLKKLRELTSSQKFGRLIEDAIKTWTSHANPDFGNFGLELDPETNTFRLDSNKKCCLVGAAFLGKNVRNGSFLDGLKAEYSIKNGSYIWAGFDGSYITIRNESYGELYELGRKVRNILRSRDE